IQSRVAISAIALSALLGITASDTRLIRGGNGVTLPLPPGTEAKPVTDVVNGTPITDPYRWLEDGKSPETRAWIASQMKYTEEYVSQVKIRPEIAKRVKELVRVESFSIPVERQGSYFFNKRLPDENQASIYVRKGLHGSEERLVDAAKLSADQNTSVHIADISKAGDLLAYTVREGGADEQIVRLLDVNKNQDLPDVLPRARYSQINIAPDKRGLYYGRLDPSGSVIYYHRLGTPSDSDQVIFGKESNGEKFGQMELIGARVTENERYFLIEVYHGVPATRVDVYAKDLRALQYPTLGSASGVCGLDDSENAFYTFESFIIPPAIYHYDLKTGKTEVFAKPQVPFPPELYEVKQVFYTSKDGTRVPMFISSKKGVKANGNAPALMVAYGGFNISLGAKWNPECVWWMEQGGFYAQPNLRGGGEYGENWHKGGMFEKKQNVFDDFFAAAEYLIANKYTTAERLAIRGRSNGGLLMGAAMTQRPDLFGAIWCGYPLLDMMRYQNFLVGRWWTTEYGSAENAQQFPYLLKYSPYQNVKPGTKYPAIMFNSGDSDTRVDPLHARKMTALMQAETGSNRPILLHYELKAGHSAGVSITQLVSDTVDELAFLWNESGGK